MVLVGSQIQLLRPPRAVAIILGFRLGRSCYCLGQAFFLTPCLGSPLAFQFPSRKYETCFILECAYPVAKRCSDVGQKTQSCVSVHTEFGETMPVSQIKEELENICIVGLGQKLIKNRYGALDE